MVVAPFEALQDVGYTWQTWGGVWGASADPVHFQYPGFVPPPTENVVQTAARTFADLPWYVSLLTPVSTLLEKTKRTDFQKSPVLCKLTGMFC